MILITKSTKIYLFLLMAVLKNKKTGTLIAQTAMQTGLHGDTLYNFERRRNYGKPGGNWLKPNYQRVANNLSYTAAETQEYKNILN